MAYCSNVSQENVFMCSVHFKLPIRRRVLVGSAGGAGGFGAISTLNFLIFAVVITYLNEEVKDVFLELPQQAHKLRNAYRFSTVQ